MNRIHFEDMENKRFEDLAQLIVQKLKAWSEVNHIGRSGSDDGVDIEAIEDDDGTRRRWAIQCKRYQTFSLSHATAAIDEAVKDGTPIDVLLLVVGCDVSKATLTGARAHAASKGVKELRIWDATYLEATLVNDRNDLLFIYFGIDIKRNAATREKLIKARVAMREKIKAQFMLSPKERTARKYKRDAWEWNEPNIIIRDVNDETYPNVTSGVGMSPWIKVEPLDFYHNGIRVMLSSRQAVAYPDGTWQIVNSSALILPEGVRNFTVYLIGRIPFDNILSFTKSSDEYGMGPTIFCRFANGGEPYEAIEFATMYGDNEGFHAIEPSKQRTSTD